MVPAANAKLDDWWLPERLRLAFDARPAFDTLALLVSWSLWNERNKRTFQGTSVGINDLYRVVISEADIWVEAGFRTLAAACPF